MNTANLFTITARLPFVVLAALCALSPALGCDEGPETEVENAPADQIAAPDAASEMTIEISDQPRDGEIKVYRTTLADIEVPRGPRVVFIDVADADEAPAIGVYEFVPTGNVGTSAFKELVGASPLELFRAVTGDDVEIPARLLEAAAAADERASVGAEPRARGWLREAVATAVVPRGSCTDSEFQDVVNSFGYADNGTPDFRLNKEPGVSGFFQQVWYAFPAEGTGTYGYEYTVGGNHGSIWYDIDAYYTRVAVCDLGSHPNLVGGAGTVVHPGPTINFSYRDSSNNPFSFATALNHDYNGTGVSYWHWYTGSNWDWKSRIDLGQEGDLFDIGHAVAVD